MRKFIMMIGLPGSGKSTQAARILKSDRDKNTIMVSSDDLRESLLKDVYRQSENAFIFETMKLISIKALNEGKDVIYDAVNVEEERRRAIVTEIRAAVKEKIYVELIYMVSNYGYACKKNAQRNRSVLEKSILKLTKKLDIPTKRDYDYIDRLKMAKPHDSSGESSIDYKEVLSSKTYEEFIESISVGSKDFSSIVDMPQDSPAHPLSVSRHSYEAFKYCKDNLPSSLKEHKNTLLIAIAFHDVGKKLCKTFDANSKYASFVGHEKVSAQAFLYAVSEDKERLIRNDVCIRMASSLIKEHHFPYEDKDPEGYAESLEKMTLIYGKDFVECIKFFRECDISSK